MLRVPGVAKFFFAGGDALALLVHGYSPSGLMRKRAQIDSDVQKGASDGRRAEQASYSCVGFGVLVAARGNGCRFFHYRERGLGGAKRHKGGAMQSLLYSGLAHRLFHRARFG